MIVRAPVSSSKRPDSDRPLAAAPAICERRALPAGAALRRRARPAGPDQVGRLGAHVGRRRVIGFDRAHLREPLAACFYTETVVPPTSRAHVIQKNLSILKALSIAPPGPELPLQPMRERRDDRGHRGRRWRRRIRRAQSGRGVAEQALAAGRFGALAAALRERTGLRSLVTWGPRNARWPSGVRARRAAPRRPAPPTSIADLAVMMRDAALVVSGDTGPLHIAAAMGTPLVGLVSDRPGRNATARGIPTTR